MERLTIPDKKVGGGWKRTVIDPEEVKKYAMTIYWGLKKYEDTGLAPDEINALREREAHNEWIPVEERLPATDEETEETIEDDDCPEYIVTIRGASESTVLKYSPDGTWFDENGYVYDVIAWRPLPEPYQPETETQRPEWKDRMLHTFLGGHT